MSAKRHGAALSASALVAVSAALVATRHGPGLSPDSITYVSAARNLVDRGELTGFDGHPMTMFPPGYSVLLSGFEAVDWSIQAAVGFNLVCTLATIAGTYLLGRRMGHPGVGLVAAVLVGTLPGANSVVPMLWSEPPFTACVVLWLLGLEQVHRTRRLSRGAVACVVAGAFLACSLRYAGVALLPVTLLVSWQALSTARRRPFVTSTALTAVASLGILVVVTRNIALGSGPLGLRGSSDNSPSDVVAQLLVGLGSSVPGLGLMASAAVGGMMLIGLLAAGSHAAARRSAPLTRHPAWPLGVFVACYVLLIMLSELRTTIDPINARLLHPVLPALTILAGLAVRHVLADRFRSGRPARIPAGLAVLGAAVLAAVSLGEAWTAGGVGVGYQRLETSGQAWVSDVRELAAGTPVVSDDPWRVYWATGHQPAVPAPPTFYNTAHSTPARAADIGTRVRGSGPMVLVCFGPLPGCGAPDLRLAGVRLADLAGADRVRLFELRPE